MILLEIPTRGRPDQAWMAAESALANSTRGDTRVRLIYDDDDPCSPEYRELADRDWRLHTTSGPRVRMGPALNREAVQDARVVDVVGFMGDDHRIRTHGWDALVADTLAVAPGVCYGDDQVHGANLATAAFQSAVCVRALGYYHPPGLTHLYLDNYWMDLGRATHLSYLPQLTIEHLHPIAGKAEWDAGYIEVNSGEVQSHDHDEYHRYLAEDWPDALEKLAAAGLR